MHDQQVKINTEIHRSMERSNKERQDGAKRRNIMDAMLDKHLSMEQMNTHEKQLLDQLRDSLQRHAEESYLESSRRSYRK